MNMLHHNSSRLTDSATDESSETAIDHSPGAVCADGEPVLGAASPDLGPMWRVVGASLTTGLVAALVLTLVVLAGAPEHVIVGSALLAFATGWSMLAVLSTHLTTQPQRWALAPAALMAVAGLGLLVAGPDDRTLNAVGWVWPPIGVALAVWIVVQLRRSLSGKVRWLLYPVVAALFLGSVGGMYETVALERDQRSYPAPGTLYDVGGHRLHLNCSGSGSPTVVLENGLGEMSLIWSRITADLSSTTRVCSYDRAGQGWSDDATGPQDGLAVASDLHTVLERAGESGPYVLVGHSAGGTYAMVYAAQYPDEVAGMVLLDSMSPDNFTVLPDFETEYSMMRRGLGVLPSLARMGIARVLPASVYSNLPEPQATQYHAFATSPRSMRNMRDEHSVYRDVFTQAQTLTGLAAKPLVVITVTESLDETSGWSDAQAELAALSSNSEHRIVDATHGGMLDDPDTFGSSVSAIGDVVQSIRADAPVVTR
jgi:pimeloyl-ACP methyl ester carboxylesterase